jgi:hypothetical protein
MPGLHTRKLINLGGSKVVALPQEWLRWLELEYGPVRRSLCKQTASSSLGRKLSGNAKASMKPIKEEDYENE